MSLRAFTRFVAALVIALTFSGAGETATMPTGFVEETVGDGWNQVAGLTFDDHGRLYVTERGGRVWILDEDGVKLPQPFVDISEEVGGWRDYGLLGFALHPDFKNTGYVYLLYVVDHHHLVHFGKPTYDPNADEYFQATIGRITRYTAQLPPGEDTYEHATSIDPSTRLVLVGESIDTGFPILHQSHGIGTILFGTDGTLLASCGDGASYSALDTGGDAGSAGTGSYYAQALAEGIIQPKEDVGAFRSLLVDSLNGKVIRVDPATGNGLASNPFYDAANPRSARSRVWALGLRNPFRMCLRPGTGSHFPSAGDPGVLYIGDVGWGTWEELNVAKGPGANFGWPAFEGMTRHDAYWNSDTANLDAPNPLNGQGGCDRPHFFFRDLIQQATLDPNPFFPNPCDPTKAIPGSLDLFLHTRPAIDWRHGNSGPARTGIFVGNDAAVVNLDDPASPVPGPNFSGNCSVGGTWYTGTQFPPAFQNTYFHADYSKGWIRAFKFDGNDNPVEVADFLTGGGGIVALAACPADGCLYYVSWTDQIRKISYVPAGNVAPTAVASADVTYGPGPLTVQFTGTGSTDPEGLPLTYAWDFGDGSPTSDVPNPVHVFDASAGVPTPYTVHLTVRDSEGLVADATLLISVNNTPPSVDITSIPDVSLYSIDDGDIVVDLVAAVTDAEHGAGELSYAWLTVLHHNIHTHEEPVDPNPVTTTVISPIGCDGQTYYYRIRLTVTDAAGLTGTDEAFWYPDCGGFNGDFEGDVSGWGLTGLWHRVEDGGPCGDSRSPTHSMYYGQSGACNYDAGTTTGSLTSPPVPMGTGSAPKLSFFHRFEIEFFEAGSYDQLHVEISDGGPWVSLRAWDSTGASLPDWTKEEIDLSAYVGQTVQVRFRFDTVDDQFNDFAGWYVDDVVFSGLTDVPQPPNADFTASPTVGAAPLTVAFTDESVNDATAWAWDFDNDGVIDSTARNPVHTYAAAGDYTVRLTATNDLGADEEVKVAYVVVTGPAHDWTDDMEGGADGWIASGLWHLAAGAASCGVAAHSGTAQWVFTQDATCMYDNGSEATGSLETPNLVLASGSTLRFFHQFETETFDGPYDRCIVEIDAGAGWVELVSWDSADPNVEAWTEQTVDLGAYAGQAVRIRFRFDTVDDLFNDYRGWNVDDVTVTNVLTP